jgi:S1-C subfamily serine protease
MEGNVVKVTSRKRLCDYVDFWNSGKLQTTFGSGFCVLLSGKKLVITNSHVIEDSVYIEVSHDGVSYPATTFANILEMDIALLSVNNSEFRPNELKLSQVKNNSGDSILTYGYPGGGDKVSVTKGIASRWIVKTVNHIMPQILLQIDAATNKGNSGGPAIDEETGSVAGVTVGCASDMQGVSYIIPSHAILRAFESDYSCCDLGLKIVPIPGALQITKVKTGSVCFRKLKEGDIIKEIDGNTNIQNPSDYVGIIREKNPWDAVGIVVKRDNQELHFSVVLENSRALAAPYNTRFIDKRYYVFAGLDFASLNLRYLSNAPEIPDDIQKYRSRISQNGKQILILKSIMVSDLTEKYKSRHYTNLVLKKINGERVNNMDQLYNLCEAVPENDETMIHFTFKHAIKISLPHKGAHNASMDIARMYIQNSYHNFNE